MLRWRSARPCYRPAFHISDCLASLQRPESKTKLYHPATQTHHQGKCGILVVIYSWSFLLKQTPNFPHLGCSPCLGLWMLLLQVTKSCFDSTQARFQTEIAPRAKTAHSGRGA